MKRSLFYYRPRTGDIWTVKMPGKQRITKTVRRVRRGWYEKPWTLEKGYVTYKLPKVDWVRVSKGRYSGVRVRWLLKYGRLLSRGLPIDYNAHSGTAARRRIARVSPAIPRKRLAKSDKVK